MRRLAWLVLVGWLAACGGGGGDPVAPTPPPAPACQTQNTGTLVLQNRSASGTTFTVYVNNGSWGTEAPSQQLGQTVTAGGAQYSVYWYITNTSRAACSAVATPVQCQTVTYYCAE